MLLVERVLLGSVVEVLKGGLDSVLVVVGSGVVVVDVDVGSLVVEDSLGVVVTVLAGERATTKVTVVPCLTLP